MKVGSLNYSVAKTFINESVILCFEQSGELRLGLSCDLLPGFQLTFAEMTNTANTSKGEGAVSRSENILQ